MTQTAIHNQVSKTKISRKGSLLTPSNLLSHPKCSCFFLRSKHKEVRLSQAIWCGRIAFVACLTLLAAILGYLVYRQQDRANQQLAESLFTSTTDQALIKVAFTLRQQQWTITSLATVIGHLLPDAEQWPFVKLASFQSIAHDLLPITRMNTLVFSPIILPEQREDFEDHAQEYFQQRNYTVAPSEIFQIINGTRIPDNGTSSSWGSPHQILTPVLEVEGGDNPLLLYNPHADLKRGKPIDTLMNCVEQATNEEQRCTTLSTLITSHKETERRGPSSANWAPVFPADDPETLVGLTGALIVWENLLETAFSRPVSGMDAVLTNSAGEAFTYTIVEGVATVKGNGDLHDRNYDCLVRSMELTNSTLFADMMSYTLYFYPNQELYNYPKENPLARALITVSIVVFVSMLFFVYDFCVRREFSAKKELLEAKRHFVRFISHEIRTPLNAVVMGLSVVQHEIAASLGYHSAEAFQEDLENNPDLPITTTTCCSPTGAMAVGWFQSTHDILDNTNSAVEILSDLLNFDKIQSNTLTLELTKVPIWSLSETTMDEFRLSATKKQIQFCLDFEHDGHHYHHSKDLPLELRSQQVIGDEVRLRQVLRNLASNAVKFTPERGTMTVRVRCIPWRSPLATKETDFELKDGQPITLSRSGTLEVSVEDSGAGMSTDQLGKLFSVGVQFNVNELQGGKGSGLGLFITKGIVEQHEGELVVSSPGLGLGSKFTMTLPLFQLPLEEVFGKDQEQKAEDIETGDLSSSIEADGSDGCMYSTEPDVAAAIKKSLRVLVVDDIATNRKLLGRLLKIHGHSCDEAEDGRQGVDLFRKAMQDGAKYDSVLLDFEMPVLNGPETAKEICKLCSEANIVGVTGNMLREDVALFKSCGATDVIGKPFQMPKLEEIWKRCGLLSGDR